MANITNREQTLSKSDVEATRDQLLDELQSAWDDLFEKDADAYEAWLIDSDSDGTTVPIEPPKLEAWVATQAADPLLENYETAVEYLALNKLCDQCDGYPGDTLINDDHFEDYIREMLCDSYGIPTELHNVLAIDWAATAEQHKSDYAEVDYDGQAFHLTA